MDQAKLPVLLAVGTLSLLILGYIGYSVFSGEKQESVTITEAPIEIPVIKVEVEPEPVAEPEPQPEPESEGIAEVEPEISFVLPILNDSDQLVRDGVRSLSQHVGLAKWLMPDELIRKFVVLVDNVANGSIPRNHVPFLAPESGFKVQQVTEDLYQLDSESFSRYDPVTEIFVSFDSQRAVELYVLLRPLFQEAFSDLGYEREKFDDVIFVAIGRLLETPTVSPPIDLVRPVVMYEFADDKLESLSAVQKQLVRMGTKNTRLIQAKLSELAFELRAVLE